eukprot:SAG31_NODE_13364_length_874_cov_1.441290_2_plen_84_part_00
MVRYGVRLMRRDPRSTVHDLRWVRALEQRGGGAAAAEPESVGLSAAGSETVHHVTPLALGARDFPGAALPRPQQLDGTCRSPQ